MDGLSGAVLSDPSIHFVKQPAFLGRKKRRWFVLHRASHKLAYYVRPFVPPAKGEIKGVINLAEVVDVYTLGAKLEIKVAKGRSTFKLLADSDKVARDWAALIRIEAHTSGLENPLNRNVQAACGTNNKQEDPLYAEYGGFKFADQNPELYTDYDPKLTASGKTQSNDEENYGNFTPNDNVEDEELPTDGAYLVQEPPKQPTDLGYLDNATATVNDDDEEDNAADVSSFTPEEDTKSNEPNPFAGDGGDDATPTTTETIEEPILVGTTSTAPWPTMDDDEPTDEPVTEPVTEVVTEAVTEPATEPVTEPVTEAVTEAVTEPVTEPVTEAVTEPVTEPVTEAVTEAVTEPVTEPVVGTTTTAPCPTDDQPTTDTPAE